MTEPEHAGCAMTPRRQRRSPAFIGPIALVCLYFAGCSGLPTYVPESADVVTASSVRGTLVHLTLASGTSVDLNVSEFLDGPGLGDFLLLRGTSPKPWAYQVYLSKQSYVGPGCYVAYGTISDAGDRVDINVPASNGKTIVLRVPKSATFTNQYTPARASIASGDFACLDARGEATSTWQ
jgi:hypothetical protein